MTIREFADALQGGTYFGGFFYPNVNGAQGYQGRVVVGDDHYIYKVSGTDDEVLPATVVTAITADSATIRRCEDDGQKFDATIWQGDHCYMLWHRRR